MPRRSSSAAAATCMVACAPQRCAAGLPRLVRTFPVDGGVAPAGGVDAAVAAVVTIPSYEGESRALLVGGDAGVTAILDLPDLFDPTMMMEALSLSTSPTRTLLPLTAASLVAAAGRELRELRLGASAWNYTNVTEARLAVEAADVVAAAWAGGGAGDAAGRVLVASVAGPSGGVFAYRPGDWSARERLAPPPGGPFAVLPAPPGGGVAIAAAGGDGAALYRCPSGAPPCDSTALPIAAEEDVRSITAADLDRDGATDLVFAAGGAVIALTPLPNGTWARRALAAGLGADHVVVATNGSARPQVVAAGAGGAWVLTPASEDPGTWRYDAANVSEPGAAVGPPLVADINEDGWQDLLLPLGAQRRVAVLSWSPGVDYDCNVCWDCLNLNGRCPCCCRGIAACARCGARGAGPIVSPDECHGTCGGCRNSTDWLCPSDPISGGTCLCTGGAALPRDRRRRPRQPRA